jgi:myo-inositol catabolism protein IolS
MEYFKLSGTNLSPAKIALGCWGFAGGSMWGPQEEADSIATVHAALDAGVNFFENAHGYGDGYAEEVLGKALAGRRQEAVIATKINVSDEAAKDIPANCELSLKRLRTDYIDLLQLHWPNHSIPIEEILQAFARLRDSGKIRSFGVSNFGVADLAEILDHGDVASNQLAYSLLFRAIEYELQPLCVQEEVGILCYSTLLHGLLAGKYATPAEVPDGRGRTRHFSKERSGTRHNEYGYEVETFAAIDRVRQISAEIDQPMSLVSVAWVLHQPGVAAAIVGARQPEQIQQVAAAADLNLDPQTLKELDQATQPVKQILGSNPDMWMTESRYR